MKRKGVHRQINVLITQGSEEWKVFLKRLKLSTQKSN
jgi:hypothetical protein